jgi:hypothetical protein
MTFLLVIAYWIVSFLIVATAAVLYVCFCLLAFGAALVVSVVRAIVGRQKPPRPTLPRRPRVPPRPMPQARWSDRR